MLCKKQSVKSKYGKYLFLLPVMIGPVSGVTKVNTFN